MNEQQQTLECWNQGIRGTKEIAKIVGKSKRQVRRYKAALGLGSDMESEFREKQPIQRKKYHKPIRLGFIPDTHCCPNHRKDRLKVIKSLARYFKDKEVDAVIHIGDANDMASLSSYDRGTAKIEGKRLKDELEFSQEWQQLFNDEMEGLAESDRFMTLGNHCNRLFRYYNDHPELVDLLGPDPWKFTEHGWNVSDFLSMLEINGVYFSHYFQNPTSVMGHPIGGTIENCIKNLGHSFAQGHVQTLKQGKIHRGNGDVHCGLIAGVCHIQDHDYKGPQGNNHWRGALILENVHDGYFDVHEIGLRSLLKYS